MALMLTLAACQTQDEGMLLIVHPEITGCADFGVRHCMQVKFAESDADWTLFPFEVDGFAFEQGYEYELRVAVEGEGADAQYSLLEIESKTLR